MRYIFSRWFFLLSLKDCIGKSQCNYKKYIINSILMSTFNGQIINHTCVISNKLYYAFLQSNIFIFSNYCHCIDHKRYPIMISEKYFMQSYSLCLLRINFEPLYSHKFIKDKFKRFVVSDIFF